MELGHFVIGHVRHRVAVAPQGGHQFVPVPVRFHLHTDKDVGLVRVPHAVVELGDHAPVDELAKLAEAAGPLGDSDREDRLAFFTDLGALGDVAQPVEIHIGAADDGGEGSTLGPLSIDVFFQTRHRQGPGGLGDGAGVIEDILDGGADFIGGDGNHLVQGLTQHPEGFLAHLGHRRAIGKQAHLLELDPPAPVEGGLEAGGVIRLHGDDLHLRTDKFDIGGDARAESTAAHADKDGVEGSGQLAQEFQGYGSLTRNHLRIIERVDIDHTQRLHQLRRVGGRRLEAVSLQYHLAAEGLDGGNLDLRGGAGHHNGGLDPQRPGRHGHTLGMVARGRRHHAFPALGIAELAHAVVGAPQFEGEHRLEVLALEQHPVVEAAAQLRGEIQRGFVNEIVDIGVEDTLDVAIGHEIRSPWQWPSW